MPFMEAAGRRREYQWAGPRPEDAPTLAFPRQGLGSLSMWRDFPAALADATGCGMLGYSRWGHGKSEPLCQGHAGRPVDVLMPGNRGHSPHRDMRETVPAAAAAFVRRITEREASAA